MRGRKRKFDPTIPGHIDQKKLPVGCYWDKRDRVWYTLAPGSGRTTRRRIAGPDAPMSELHLALEKVRGVDRRTLGWLMDQYLASPKFQELAPRTRDDYSRARGLVATIPTRVGVQFDGLEFARLQTHHFQRLVDSLAEAGTPTKANQIMRFIRLVYSWSVRRGHAQTNPVKGVEQAKERKRRRLPSDAAMTSLIMMAADGARLVPRTSGSCPPYLWAVADITYLCRLRGIETITLMEDAGGDLGILTNRRKGSRDNIVAWTPRLRSAWEYLISRRDAIWNDRRMPVPMLAKDRPLVVSETGEQLKKSSLDSAWQRLITKAVADGVISADERFGLHDLKRKGVTDTPGNRHEKREASGHKSEQMMEVYDLSRPIVNPSDIR